MRFQDPTDLHDHAVAAARIRCLATHPDVVALRVERIRAEVDACVWFAIGLGLAFTTVNVATFAADGAAAWSAAWVVAWLLDPMVSVLLIGVLRAEQVTARWQVATGARVAAVKWACFAATYAMNTWTSWSAGTPKGVVLHSIPPIVVLLGAEVAPELRDRLTAVSITAATTDVAPKDDPAVGPTPDDKPPNPPADPRVRELADLLADGCPVTGAQASAIHGCSTRTGRRLLAEARALAATRQRSDGQHDDDVSALRLVEAEPTR